MITVIGTGTGAPLPSDATAAVAGAALVVGGRRHLAAVSAVVAEGVEQVVLGALAPALDTIEEYVGKERPVVVLASGDPGFFGIVRALAERFGAGRLDVRPGVSSVAAAFARVGLTWDDAVIVSAHGRALRTAVNVCRARPKVAVLTGPGAGPAELGAALAGGPGARVLVVASALGDPELERVERVTPAEAAGRDWGDAVSVVLCLDEARTLAPVPVTVAGEFVGPGRWALDEREFAHRDSMITKFEVRALALARLGPRLGDLVWDIGAGSGSVAVECARLGAAVVAVEKTPDGAERVRANAAAHGVDVRVVEGSAPDQLPASMGELDEPDAVFIGGGGRELPAIVAVCAGRARRTVVVAMAALDRVPAVRAALVDAGLDCDGVLLQSSRLAPLPGEVSRLAATNPVFLLWGTRPAALTDRHTGREGVTL
ncbi:bifunctional cobalt-precorrin-7 (C(5))-methyltransferase/cobalt-precorrin-6B (C(15))-methyltransferase [Streptomyces turgidiscabies]|uniref:Precorrin-6y C5,15-methyltransferase (Decarboxylating), CbiE subunit n=1 Tax=Streptomyces turgidiscabies (strain Car8) TaxID=698760 RepID=L7FEK9_STRT8|nr:MULTISPECIES: bifunctional cobalt-precorrin-7 (C(5))-methyltransferase/cobalt-precorrin-6B (C(15))-methyltransferase [Streptomyces]ELP69624.1 precorrin-6y C5,15-methyltransferase (decarboxylating), CbiE subunit [Streptomyces turgidiscabies Car8]MDX3498874.1 bifunctional cobalt-precorrin-7 (C(5))-methyltransferase/cobalt-precorrin-6B (C(15))-methyltransferase [Streptomyces turgidiscabies]GAQ76212.1 precorrin-6Y C(5,15)-methyltransferase [Streptomyces turgidiscabies]